MVRAAYISLIVLLAVVIAVAGLKYGSSHTTRTPVGGAAASNTTSTPPAETLGKVASETRAPGKPMVNITVSVVGCNNTLYTIRCSGVNSSYILGLVEESAREHGVSIENMSINVIGGVLVINFSSKSPIWVSDGECYLDTSWVLSMYNLDLIENGFRETNHTLTWSGAVNNTIINIEFILPMQNQSYTAWGYPVGHCHAHVWWPLS